MRITFVILSLLLFANGLQAQKTLDLPKEYALPKTGLKAAYMGSILYPGFKIGVERPSKVLQIDKTKKSGIKSKMKERYWTFNLGYYRHATFHQNFYLLAERQHRRQKRNGYFVEFASGLGYSRTFLDGATYTVDENGVVDKKSLAGYNYAMLSFGGGFGYDFSRKTETPLKVYLKTSALIMAPYNSFLYLRPTMELGAIYVPKSFWKASPTLRTKKK